MKVHTGGLNLTHEVQSEGDCRELSGENVARIELDGSQQDDSGNQEEKANAEVKVKGGRMLVRVQGRVEALDDREELPDDKRTDEVVKDTSKD